MTKYYIKSNGKIYGPAEASKIRERLSNNVFSQLSQVSIDKNEWIPVSEVGEFNSFTTVNDNAANNEITSNNKFDNNITPTKLSAKTHNVGKWVVGLIIVFIVFLCLSLNLLIFIPKVISLRHEKSKLQNVNNINQKTSHQNKGTISLFGRKQRWKNTNEFSEVVEYYKKAVGVVTVTLEDKNGVLLNQIMEYKVPATTPIGTAFAIGTNEFATNCHVAYALKFHKADSIEEISKMIFGAFMRYVIEKEGIKSEQEWESFCAANNERILKTIQFIKQMVSEQGIRIRSFDIRLNHSNGHSLKITAVKAHPKYSPHPDDIFRNAEYDVAVLCVSEENKVYFPIATEDELYSLKIAQEIAYLGFPMEGLVGNGNIDVDKPEATFKKGTINKITDFNNVFSSPEMNRSIIHDIPTVGGASGSPIFLANSHVVAILWGGIFQSIDEQGARIGSSAQQNFAVRIDVLQEVLSQNETPIEDWGK